MNSLIKNLLPIEIVAKLRLIYPLTISKIFLIFIKNQFKTFGKYSTITYPSIFEGKKNISIGEYSDIGAFVHIWGTGGVTIGNRVLIASHTSITSLTHDHSKEIIKFAPIISRPIIIEDDVWIGSHVVIMPGVKVGKGAVIGAGSIVTKNIPPMAIAMGVPAKVVKYREIGESQ